jgi:hypothetical protein
MLAKNKRVKVEVKMSQCEGRCRDRVFCRWQLRRMQMQVLLVERTLCLT